MLYEKIMTINPCLHCGGKGVLKGRKKRKVVCTNCGAQGAEKPLASEAVASWNTLYAKENPVAFPPEEED